MRREEEIPLGLGKVQDTSVKTKERRKRKMSGSDAGWIPTQRDYMVNVFGAGFPVSPERW